MQYAGILVTVLGLCGVLLGAQRALGHRDETFKFVDVLRLNEHFQQIFGVAQLVAGVFLLLRLEIDLSLIVSGALHFLLLLAGLSVGDVSPEAVTHAVGWLSIHVAAYFFLTVRQRRA